MQIPTALLGLWVLASMLWMLGAMATPVVVERQLPATAMAKLQAIALIKQYALTDWCVTWLTSIPVKTKFDYLSDKTDYRREEVKRTVVRPAVLALFAADTLTQACDDVIDGTAS